MKNDLMNHVVSTARMGGARTIAIMGGADQNNVFAAFSTKCFSHASAEMHADTIGHNNSTFCHAGSVSKRRHTGRAAHACVILK